MNKVFKRLAAKQLPDDEQRFGFVPRENARTRKLRDAFKMSLAKYPFVPALQPADA